MSEKKEETVSKKETKKFLLEMLQDLETIKGNVYSTQVFPAYRNIQKMSDRIKTKIVEL